MGQSIITRRSRIVGQRAAARYSPLTMRIAVEGLSLPVTVLMVVAFAYQGVLVWWLLRRADRLALES